MKKFSWYVGIDVSKDWLDVAIISLENEPVKNEKIDNTVIAITDYIQSLQAHPDEILFCLENTGRYGNAFLQVLRPCN